jgi:hypothetical protein
VVSYSYIQDNSLFCSFCLCRLFPPPRLRFMPVIYIREQHSIFALKMGRVFLSYWEYAGRLPHILWKPPFKIFFVYRLKRSILLAGAAEVRALLFLIWSHLCFSLSCLSHDHSFFVVKLRIKFHGTFISLLTVLDAYYYFCFYHYYSHRGFPCFNCEKSGAYMPFLRGSKQI